VAFRPDSFGLWYYKVSKMWSVIFLGPKIFGLWWSVVVCGGLWCSGRPVLGHGSLKRKFGYLQK